MAAAVAAAVAAAAILFFVDVVILLLFAHPPHGHRRSPFLCPLLFTQAAASPPQYAMVGCCLRLSAALFVVAHRPVIANDCVTGRRPLAHLVALVSLAAGTFVALWTRSSSILSSSSRVVAQACRWARSCGGEPAGPPALVAVIAVLAERRGGSQTKPCAALPIRCCGHYDPTPAAGQSCRPSSSPPSASVKDTDDDDDDVVNGGSGLWQRGQWDHAVVVVVVIDNDGNDGDERIIEAEQRGRTTKDVVCPICHPPLSSSCDCQHFLRRPPSPIANLRQPLSYPSPLPLPSMVGCCVPRPPSSIPTEPPS